MIKNIYLSYTENLREEKELIKELVAEVNRKLDSRHSWFNLVPINLARPLHGDRKDREGIHLGLISHKENPNVIGNLVSSSESSPTYVLARKDHGNGSITADSTTTETGTTLNACMFDNADTLRTYVILLLEPFIRQITGEEVVRYQKGNLHALGIHIAELDNVPFAANNHGLQRLRQKLDKLNREKTTAQHMRGKEKGPKTCTAAYLPLNGIQSAQRGQEKKAVSTAKRFLTDLHNRQVLEAETSIEVKRLLHAALRLMDIYRSDSSALMKQVFSAFEKGETKEACFLLDGCQDVTCTTNDSNSLSPYLNRTILKAAMNMAHTATPIGERTEETKVIFESAIGMAKNSKDPCLVRLMADYSAFLYRHARKPEDLAIAINAANLLWRTKSDMHGDATITYMNIAEACHSKEDYLGALEHYKKALETCKETWGDGHPYIATVYHAMAKTIIPLGYYTKALAFLDKAKTIRVESLGKRHPVTADTYDDMGSTYHRMGEDERALHYYHMATAIRESTLGANHPKTAASYTNTGFVFYNRKEFTKALSLFLKALAICQQQESPIHDMATLFGHIADTYYNMGDYKKALEYHTWQLLSHSAIYGPENTGTASLYSNIGNCHLLQENYTKALENYGKALAIRVKALGTENTLTASSYYDLGTAHACLKDYPKALRHFDMSLEIRQRILGDRHTDTQLSCWKVGLIYFEMRNYRAAIPYLEKTAEAYGACLEADNPKTADIYSHLGYAYYNLMENQRAMDYFCRAVKIQERVLGHEHPKYKSSCFFYAKLLESNNKGNEAVVWGRKATRAFPTNADAASTAASACMKTGRYLEAMEQYSRCLNLRREQGASKESIHETEIQIEKLKSLMINQE